jgi:hypothetical protein
MVKGPFKDLLNFRDGVFQKMKLTKLFRKIISKEAYNDLGIFFSDVESFEEIPLISRHHRLKTLKKSASSEEIVRVYAVLR